MQYKTTQVGEKADPMLWGLNKLATSFRSALDTSQRHDGLMRAIMVWFDTKFKRPDRYGLTTPPLLPH